MAHGRIVRRRPDAYAYSNSRADANAESNSDADTHAESRHGMQWGPDLDRGRDIYRRPARESERRPLRSQVVDSKPESGD